MKRSIYIYSSYGITFGSTGSWSFGNEFARNFITFGVDNSSSSHTDIRNYNFLILGENPTYDINGRFASLEKKFSIAFNIANTKLSLSLHYNANNSYLFVNETKSLNLKLTIKMSTFQFNFVSEVFLIVLVRLILEKYLYMEMSMIFQSIAILLINLTY